MTDVWLYSRSSVIRQKGESQNGYYKKTKLTKFSEKRTFLTPWYAHVRTFNKWFIFFFQKSTAGMTEDQFEAIEDRLEDFRSDNLKSLLSNINSTVFQKNLKDLLVRFYSVLSSFPKAVVRRCSTKYVFLKISQNLQENTCVGVFFNKVVRKAFNFIKKEIPTQVFSCEYCEVFKKTYFHWTPLVAASSILENSLSRCTNFSPSTKTKKARHSKMLSDCCRFPSQ